MKCGLHGRGLSNSVNALCHAFLSKRCQLNPAALIYEQVSKKGDGIDDRIDATPRNTSTKVQEKSSGQGIHYTHSRSITAEKSLSQF